MKKDLVIPLAAPLRERRTTPDHIAEALREAILTGAFDDGEELNQVALAGHFGVSRVPIREALRQLQAEGLVTAEAHRRAVVTRPTRERLVEIFDVRLLLEGYLLEKAILVSHEQHVPRLRKLCEKMDGLEDHSKWLRKNREFHPSLYEPSGAALTISLVEQLSARVERYLHLRGGQGVHRQDQANSEHRSILDAVGKDIQRARLDLQLHISRTREMIM